MCEVIQVIVMIGRRGAFSSSSQKAVVRAASAEIGFYSLLLLYRCCDHLTVRVHSIPIGAIVRLCVLPNRGSCFGGSCISGFVNKQKNLEMGCKKEQRKQTTSRPVLFKSKGPEGVQKDQRAHGKGNRSDENRCVFSPRDRVEIKFNSSVGTIGPLRPYVPVYFGFLRQSTAPRCIKAENFFACHSVSSSHHILSF
jgi:hypothetical protein